MTSWADIPESEREFDRHHDVGGGLSLDRTAQGSRQNGIHKSAALFFGMDVSPVAYVKLNRCTHSDVMSTVTSVVKSADILEHEERLIKFHKTNTKKKSVGGFIPRGKQTMGSLSIPATKLNRELIIERNVFMERLERERSFRSHVEDQAATKIEASARGYLCRKRLRLNNNIDTRFEERRNRQNTLFRNDVKEAATIRKQLNHLQKHTEKALHDLEKGPGKRKKVGGGNQKYGASSKAKLHHHATRLQCFVRRFMAHRFVNVVRLYREEEMQREACIKIQSKYRAHFGRSQFTNREHEKQVQACIRIQAHVRRHLDQRFVVFLKEHLAHAEKEVSAAVKMQQLLRSKIAKQRIMRQKMERASVVVQAGYRGFQTRNIMQREQQERLQAATKLQANMRGHLARQKSTVMKEELQERKEIAATKINALMRGNSVRKELKAKKETSAAIKIQGKMRQRAAKKKTGSLKAKRKREEQAAIRIQSITRGKQTRNAVKQHNELVQEAEQKTSETLANNNVNTTAKEQ